jgi:hypothetical protein
MSNKKKSPLPEYSTTETGGDLEQLRDILYGNQTRATDDRIDSLEKRVESNRHDLNKKLDSRLETLATATSANLESTKQALSNQLDEQSKQQTNQHKQLTMRLDEVAADFAKQLQTIQKELTESMNQQVADLTQQLLDYQAETRRTNSDLRREMLALSAYSDNQKAGRTELAQMFSLLGQQLQENIQPVVANDEASK